MATHEYTDPDSTVVMKWRGEVVKIRRWFDTGKMSVWRKYSPAWASMMSEMAGRYGGRFNNVADYESWDFPGATASIAERELMSLCDPVV